MVTKNPNKKRASVRALGCRLNQYEAIEMEGRLKSSGYEIVSFGETAELGVINTCTVTNEADAKSRNVIRRFIRKNPNALTVVVGCYSQMDANRIAMIDGVDYVIGNHDKINFLEYLDDEKPKVPVIIRDRISREDFSIGFVGEPKFEQRANLKIQDGCDFMCSFCVIPFSRGRARSRDLADLLDEAHRMAENGVKEIVLTGVNLGTYFSNEIEFLGLLEKLSNIRDLSRIRISSVEPTTIPEEIFHWMADESHPLMPYLHVPLQSGCNSVLKRMKRKYNLDEMAEFFNRATSAVPSICLGTDLMVGFPGETEEDFHETCNTFLNFPLDYCHVFTFSERKGTPAAKMYDQVPMDVRRKRSAHLRRISASKRMEFFK
ncbi:MAG: tRNA (N(6)-L-threonylcarbamoyladenosine(37)-C(2))-methylthiotransferase MtaB, partial [Opitutae bacterium]|nr:tRNA (N(6)-L-threonylcarbamoyladenosine(37)-C(2))-methylthiotransferase MtaB [Opitutae bacterium]